MQNFLDKLAEQILSENADGLGKLCIVFPSRRAGIFFKKSLASKINKPQWSPEVLGISDFIVALSPFTIEDKIVLIFELFEVYKNYLPDESFDKFYPWGEMILNDFEDLDKNLVPANEIFRIIKEQKELEENFELTFGDYEEFEKFWRTFSSRSLSDGQNDFLKTWEILGKVYKDYRKRLAEKKIGYEGMAYRKIYENIRTNQIELKWEKIIFAGFNALNKAEEGIIKELLKRGKAETYWDADEYYVKDEKQEAGFFLRKNFRNLEITGPKWISSTLAGNSEKKITVIGAPMQSGQVKALGNELRKITGDGAENTAIVLPDESLLIPLLYSIPEDVATFNITMGYPMKNTSLFSLIEFLRNLQKNKKGSKEKPVFYHTDVTGLLMHPYIKLFNPESSDNLVNQIKERNIIYVSAPMLIAGQTDINAALFRHVNNVQETIEYLYSVISDCSEKLSADNNSNSTFELEYFFIFFTQLNRLSDILSEFSSVIETETFWKLLREVLLGIRVPFSGEPLKGMQIMGMLETRSLDFENVFILSMNEGILPRGGSSGSFIPYHLRKAFRLPTYEDEDASAAYYFYRLIQKAKNVCLLYNTEPGNLSAGEKSRFIMQMENELAPSSKNIVFEELILDVPAIINKKKEITIAKDTGVINKLKEIKGFSATSLISYISCPLKFYLERIAGLKEEDDIEEFFGGATFGNIFHSVMKILYESYTGKFIRKEDFKNISRRLDSEFDSILDAAFKDVDEKRAYAAELQGKNLLYKGIIKKLAEKIIENDEKDAPFKILGLEKPFETKIEAVINGVKGEVTLYGRIDRVDEKDNTARIIDYKTGNVTSKRLKEENFKLLFEDPQYKEYFQTYFYALLYLSTAPGKNIKTGIYPLRNIGEGIWYATEENIPIASINAFKKGITELVSDIFNMEKPFTQTTDTKRCTYCPFISICYRD